MNIILIINILIICFSLIILIGIITDTKRKAINFKLIRNNTLIEITTKEKASK